MPKVSVAMATYNVAPYLRESLDCICNQTFDDLDIIIIDDASVDGTWDILKEYAEQDKRIRLIRQKHNQGLSVSRNLSIKEAHGEYLLMLDGDDLFDPAMVEKAYRKAKETDADMVLWDYVVFSQKKEIDSKKKEPSSLVNISPHNKIALLHRNAFTWVRLLKVSTLKRLGIQFTPGLTKQDIPIHWQLITSLDNIAILPERLSFYRTQPDSTTSRKDKSVFSLAYVMDITKKQLETDGIYETYRNEFLRSRLSLLQGMYDHVEPTLKEEALQMVKERLAQDEMKYIHNEENELSERVRNFYGMLEGKICPTLKYKGFNTIRSFYRFLKR